MELNKISFTENILYIGSLHPDSNSFMRYKTLVSMGFSVRGLDIEPFIFNNFFSSLHYRFNIGPGIRKLNREVLGEVASCMPGLIWVDNKSFLSRDTISKIRSLFPAVTIINLITDDPCGNHKAAWRICLATADLYDCHFVQRSVNLAELKKYGARRVELCYRSFDPGFHRPIKLDQADQEKYHCTVGFIGTHEAEREVFVCYLIQSGIPVSVTGNDWPGKKYWNIIKPFYKGPSVYGDAYIKSLNGMEIALHFLRHGNRDEQDSRTFEIPACATFMLAERSGLHQQLFEEDEEAVFFETKEELLQKIRYYIDHPLERKKIAAAGYKRSHQSGYTHRSRLETILNLCAQL